MSFIDEITQEASHRFGPSGYGQDELLRLAFEMIGKRIDELITNSKGSYHPEIQAIAFEKVKEMLK